ncbi:MAG: hypothetical protein A2469_00010 [Candidatus Magasanikbacteria bacterium RIFOXYC2_FULL_40_16]|uniref:Uncharacterized protein n=1 Tax=Candidatus Magasanikbacteria bacterium RIFOXYC2_FULL_40_16 TaxID=1798703 RepID=A0A1F6P0F4_9BACT|nr:MAG: hypothetical protein A2469_00010 [Candidatus Magasanikbacteria bacterium RIFOXYC2_FULL_40_16]
MFLPLFKGELEGVFFRHPEPVEGSFCHSRVYGNPVIVFSTFLQKKLEALQFGGQAKLPAQTMFCAPIMRVRSKIH